MAEYKIMHLSVHEDRNLEWQFQHLRTLDSVATYPVDMVVENSSLGEDLKLSMLKRF